MCNSIFLFSFNYVTHNKFNNWYQSGFAPKDDNGKSGIEKFTGKKDFGLCKLKMRVILVHQGLEDALAGEVKLLNTLTDKEKTNLLEKAHSALILSLGARVLTEVSNENTCA